MRVIIAGGTGLIGRALAASLAEDGHQVIVLSRRPDEAWGLPPGVRAVGWDGRTTDGWGRLVDGAGAVVNLAGQRLTGRWSKGLKTEIRASRIRAGRAVSQAVEWAPTKPDVVVQASGSGYYGPGDDREITEEAPAGDDFLARTAVDWERSTVAVEDVGVRQVTIRSGVVLSTAGGALPLLLLPFRLFAGGPLGSGRQWFPWIHVADEVRAIRFLIENQTARGPFNLAAPHSLTNRTWSRLVSQVLGRPTWLPVPAFVLRLVMGEASTLVLDGQRLVPQRLLDLGFAFRFPRAEEALRDLLDREAS